MPESTIILVAESWPLNDDNAAVRGNDHPQSIKHQPKTSIRAKARFDEKHNLISDKVAIRLLDCLESSTYVQFIAIRWRGCASDQTLEETHLEIVPNMECDSILFSASVSDYPKGKFSQIWFGLTVLSPLESQFDTLSSKEKDASAVRQGHDDASPFGFIRSDEAQNQFSAASTPFLAEQKSTSSELYQFASDAASHGIHFMNMETIEALAPLWSQARLASQSTYPNNNTLERGTHGNCAPYNDCRAWESPADTYRLDQEWSTGTSQTLCTAFPERLLTCDSAHASSELTSGTIDGGDWSPIYETSMEQLFTTDSTLVSRSSDDPAAEQASLSCQDQNEDSEDSTLFYQDQLNDFESHPGHKVWEWVPESEKWRRRGGTTDADWFPDFFA
ncbi:hypothetical protein QQZ08_009578 [Neonectria magnoliae]|uniref:Uncharacterized protein n=1 Tax=Neonectria magnoliae TaxID=2732573 RepID=A0ABR1HMQ4_9HYPO